MRKCEGFAVVIHRNITKYVTYIDSDCNIVLWFKMKKETFSQN